MFARSLEHVRRELDQQTSQLLRARVRTGLGVLLGADALFALADLRLAPGHAGALLLLKLLQASFVLFGFFALRRSRGLRELTLVALLVAGSDCILSASCGVVRGNVDVLPLTFIILAMATATLLPWGTAPQIGLTALASGATLWATLAVSGDLSPLFGYPAIALLVAFVVSVYVAYEFDRYRVAIEQRNLELAGYREVVENANDAILTLDASHCITGVNRGAELVFGYDRSELVGRPFGTLLTAQDAELLRGRWSEERPGDAILALDARRSGGTTVPIEIKARGIDGDSSGLRIQAILRDVTEKRIVEQMRNDFVAMLSHDMKTPLSSVLGFAEMLDDQLGDRPALRQIVERIDANARVALSLALNFLDIARIESGSLELQLESTSLNEVVDCVVRHQESMARAREISIEATLAANLPELPLDRHHIDRVVSNLVSNAIKFSPSRSRIRVGTARRDGRVVLVVRDQGPGIAPEDRPNLFQRYRRLGGGPTEGSGLGLYIVKQIVEAHGGEVRVDCPTDGGSLFEVSFAERPLAA